MVLRGCKTSYILMWIFLFGAISNGLFVAIVSHLLLTFDANLILKENLRQNIVIGSSFLLIISPIYFFMTPVVGFLSDRLGRRYVITTCIIASNLGYMLAFIGYAINSIVVLLVGCFIANIALSIFSVMQGAVSDLSKFSNRLRNYSWFSIVAVISILIFFLASQFLNLNDRYLVTNLFVVIMLSSIASLLLSCFILSETRPAHEMNLTNALPNFFSALLNILLRQRVRSYLLIMFLTQFFFGLYFQNMYIELIQKNHFNFFELLQYFTICFIIIMFFNRLILPKLSFSSKKILMFGLIIMALCILSSKLVNNYFGLILLATPFIIGLSIFYPIVWTKISNAISKSHQGIGFGIADSVWRLGWVCSGICLNYFTNSNYFLPTILTIVLLLLMTLHYNHYLRN